MHLHRLGGRPGTAAGLQSPSSAPGGDRVHQVHTSQAQLTGSPDRPAPAPAARQHLTCAEDEAGRPEGLRPAATAQGECSQRAARAAGGRPAGGGGGRAGWAAAAVGRLLAAGERLLRSQLPLELCSYVSRKCMLHSTGPAAPNALEAASFYAAAPCERQAASSGSDGRSNGSAGVSDDDVEWVPRNYGDGHNDKLLPIRPELAAELRPLAAIAGVADSAELSRSVAALGPKPERRVVEHGAAVAQLLLSLGVPRTQLAALLWCCPVLFSWPAEHRAALLFGQLARLGLTAGQAAR